MNVRAIISTAFAVLLMSASTALGQETPEDRLQSGIYAEEVQGNLEQAMAIYRSILRDYPESRAVGAKAQLHIGLCLEVLGLGEAGQAYRRVIDDFPEHADQVRLARERLASLTEELAELNRQPTFRKIEIAGRPQGGVLSPDGNQLAFSSEGALWSVPLHGRVDPDIAGEPVRLADVPGVETTGSLLSWSADGEWIAVNYDAQHYDGYHANVYLVPAAGGEPRVVQMPERGGGFFNYRLSLSPDGQQVAVSALDPDRPENSPDLRHRFLYSTSTAGGELRQMASVRSEQGAYSPDGEFMAFVSPRKKVDWPENIEREPPDLGPYDADLRIVPTAGGTAIRLATVQGRLRGPVWSPDRRFVAVHHEPGGTNASQEIWVYPLAPDASSAGEPTKISLPQPSYSLLAGWTPDDELGVFMSTEYRMALYTVSASGGPAVQVSPDGIPYYPRWSPDGERIYLRWTRPPTPANPAAPYGLAYVSAAGGEVFDVPWPDQSFKTPVPGAGHNVSPDGERFVVAAVHDDGDSAGVRDVWTIPLDEGHPVQLTSDDSEERDPCWSPNGQWVAFIERHEKSEDDGFEAIYLVPAEGGQVSQISSEADSVGAGAIAFSPDGERIAFFSGGAIKSIPVQGGRPEVLVADVRSARNSHLEWSPDGSRIAHNAGGKIWITSLDGGMSEELRTGLPAGAELSEFGWSPDGERIVFMARVGGDNEFWLISDFLPEGRVR